MKCASTTRQIGHFSRIGVPGFLGIARLPATVREDACDGRRGCWRWHVRPLATAHEAAGDGARGYLRWRARLPTAMNNMRHE